MIRTGARGYADGTGVAFPELVSSASIFFDKSVFRPFWWRSYWPTAGTQLWQPRTKGQGILRVAVFISKYSCL